MIEQGSKPKNGKRSRNPVATFFGYGCLTFLICGVGGFFGFVRMLQDDRETLPTDLEKARRLGLPLSVSEVWNLAPPVPASQNAAPIYLEAMREYQKLPRTQLAHLWLRRAATDKERLQVLRVQHSFEPVRKILERAAKLPFCRFDSEPHVRVESHFDTSNHHFDFEGLMRDMCSYLNAGCRTKIRFGDLDAALEDIRTEVAVIHSIPAYSPMTGSYSRIDESVGVLSLLWRILLRHPHDSQILDEVSDIARSIEMPDLYKLLKTTFAVNRATIASMKTLQEVGLDRNTPALFTKTVDDLYHSPGVREAYDANYVHAFLKFFQALPANNEDWVAIHDLMARTQKAIFKDMSLENALTRALGVGEPITPLLLGVLQEEQRIFLAAVYALRQRNLTGRFPLALPAQSPETTDPFSGRPLDYKVASDGFTLAVRAMDFGMGTPYILRHGNLHRYKEGWEPPLLRNAY